jgi:PKD repeat protein
MKNILTFLLVSLFALTRSAAQVTWTGAPTGGVWTTAANWSGGSVPAATDSIVLSTSATDTLLISDLPATISLVKLRIGGTTKVKFWGLTTSTVITVTGGAGTDVVIDSLASLTLASSSVIGGAGSIAINLALDATAEITGKLHFTTNTNSSANAHRLQGLIANAITFKNSAVFTMGPGASGNPFGAGTGASAANSVFFDSGSSFVFNGGSNPFALTAPAAVTIFNPNSTYKINTSGNALTPALSGRTYGNVEVTNAAYAGTSVGAGTFTVNGNFTVSAGTITLNLSGGVNIKGNITVAPAASLTFGPAVLVTLNGTTEQLLTNNGRLSFGDSTTILRVNNAAGARLATPISTRTLTLTNGCVTLDNNDLHITHYMNGGSALSHIVTNGTGVLRRENVGATAINFPVGISKLSYDPVLLTNTGTIDTFSVRIDTILTNPPASATNRNNILKREWNISENVAGGSNLTAVFSIDPSGLNLNNTTFTPATVIVGQYNNSWNSLPATLSGTDVTATGLTTVSAFAIANTGAFTAAVVAAVGGTIATPTTTICAGQAIQFNLTGAAGDTLQWQSSADSSVWANVGTVGALTLSVNPSVTTFYRVKATGTGTAYSNAMKIVVNPKPVPNFTSSVAGAMATFTNTSTGANSYAWRFGNAANSTSSAMSPTFTYATNGNYSVQLIVTSVAGCVDSITKTVVISGLVAATGGVIATATTHICIGTATQLTLTGAAGDTLQWQSSLDSSVWANTGMVGALTLSVNPSVTTFYRVKATGVGTSYSNGIKIVVNPKPVPNFTSSVTGATATFTNTSTGASTYAWRFGNVANSTSSAMSPTFAYTANGSYSVKLLVTSAAGCVDSITKTVIITGVAVGGTVSTTTATICIGQSTQLTLAGAIGDTLQWQSSADSSVWANTGTVGALTLSVTPSVTTFYRVKASGAGTTYSNVLKVVVNPKPVPNFTFTTVGGAATFTNTSTGASTYTWRFGNPTNSTSTSASPTFTYTANGNYTVQMIATSAVGCVDSTSKVVAITRVGIDETKYVYGLNIYPNPTQEVLNIDLKSTPLMSDELLVLDGLCRIKSVQPLTQSVQLTTTQWSAGIYFIAIRRDGNLQIVEKVIKN